MARVLVLDVDDRTTYEAECNELDDFCEHLKARPFDIVTRKVGGKFFDIYIDDEGRFREDPKPSAILGGRVHLVGNLIFANHDAEGNTISLTDEDIKLIQGWLRHVFDTKGNQYLVVVVQ